MARPNPTTASETMMYHCGMCDQSFKSRIELQSHVANHPDTRSSTFFCPVCHFPFDNDSSLEKHKAQTGHGTAQFQCQNCGKAFDTHRGLATHLKAPYDCPEAAKASVVPGNSDSASKEVISCDRCSIIFTSTKQYLDHRSFVLNGPCADHTHRRTSPEKTSESFRQEHEKSHASKQEHRALKYDNQSEVSTASGGGKHCSDCKQNFSSMARYNNHFLSCVSKRNNSNLILPNLSLGESRSSESTPRMTAGKTQHTLSVHAPSFQMPKKPTNGSGAMQSDETRKKYSVLHHSPAPAPPMIAAARALDSLPVNSSPQMSTTSIAPQSGFSCNLGGCNKTFRSEAALKIHQGDIHGIGGKKLDFTGKDSWMLSQRERERLRAEGLVQALSSSPTARQPGPSTARPPSTSAARHVHVSRASRQTTPPASAARNVHVPLATRQNSTQHAAASHVSIAVPGHIPRSLNMGGAAEMEQAKYIHGKILRLLIQSDIFIHHDGKMSVCEVDWTRIGTAKQPDVVGLFDEMCHLPKNLQTEYLPPPKAFKEDYKAHYNVAEFKQSPDRNVNKPGLGVVALSCCKVVLADGRHEIVKVAAIDLITCRILMNHLVCTDPYAQVLDWCSTETGLFSWDDMEGARQAGYKIFKGWPAARSALWKSIDKETIIVGHNLRSDLDVLRMVHGRAVDVAKVVEKAAKGPLSKKQLGLDSLNRDYPTVQLKSDPKYGRDALMNAFAAREVGLWICKNKEKLEKDARQKSLDYQRIMPRAGA